MGNGDIDPPLRAISSPEGHSVGQPTQQAISCSCIACCSCSARGSESQVRSWLYRNCVSCVALKCDPISH